MFLGNYIERSGFIEAHFPVSRGLNVRNSKLSKLNPCGGIDRGKYPVASAGDCLLYAFCGRIRDCALSMAMNWKMQGHGFVGGMMYIFPDDILVH